MPAEIELISAGPLARAIPDVPKRALATKTKATGYAGFGVRDTWVTLGGHGEVT